VEEQRCGSGIQAASDSDSDSDSSSKRGLGSRMPAAQPYGIVMFPGFLGIFEAL